MVRHKYMLLGAKGLIWNTVLDFTFLKGKIESECRVKGMKMYVVMEIKCTTGDRISLLPHVH